MLFEKLKQGQCAWCVTESNREGGGDEAREVDIGQEALEPTGRILDLEAFPGFGKPLPGRAALPGRLCGLKCRWKPGHRDGIFWLFCALEMVLGLSVWNRAQQRAQLTTLLRLPSTHRWEYKDSGYRPGSATQGP